MVLGLYVFERVADAPVDVALGHVLARIRHVVDVNVCCGAVRHYGNPGGVRTDREVLQNALSPTNKHDISVMKYQTQLISGIQRPAPP